MAYLTKQSGCKIGLGCISGRKVIPECLDTTSVNKVKIIGRIIIELRTLL